MLDSQNRLRRKWFVSALVLGLIFILADAFFWFSALTNQINGSYSHWYEYNITANPLSPNGDITVPTTFNSSNTIQRIDNTYILTGNLEGDLLIEKSNIIFDGKGFNVETVNFSDAETPKTTEEVNDSLLLPATAVTSMIVVVGIGLLLNRNIVA